MSNKLDGEWMNEVANIGCIVCRVHHFLYSPALIHHIRHCYGTHITRNHKFILPLCYPHHDQGLEGISFHANPNLWQQQYGNQEDLLRTVHKLIQESWEHNVYPGKESLMDKFQDYFVLPEPHELDNPSIFVPEEHDICQPRL